MSVVGRVLLFFVVVLVPELARAVVPLPDEFTWDRPDGYLTKPAPGILGGTASDVDGLLGFLALQLDPPPRAAAAAITLIVPGSSGGFIRAILDPGDGEAVLLSPDLREHTGLPEQIVVVLPASELGRAPTLEFHSSQAKAAFIRVSVAWLSAQEVFATATERLPRVVFGGERMKCVDETNEGIPLSRRDQVLPRSVDAVLHTPPLRADEGAEFSFDLIAVPEAAAFRAEIAGAFLGESLELWVNGNGPLLATPSVPALGDPGVLREGTQWTYAGWRALSLFIPGDWLAPGENMVVIQRAQTGAELPLMALKDVRLELARPASADTETTEPLDSLNTDLRLPEP